MERVFVWFFFAIFGTVGGAFLALWIGVNAYEYLYNVRHLPVDLSTIEGLIGATIGLTLGLAAAGWQVRQMDEKSD